MSVPTGQVAFSDLQTEHGGSHPISISEYYRGVGVPATQTTPAGTYTSYQASSSSPVYAWDVAGTVQAKLWWDDTKVAERTFISGPSTLVTSTTITVSGHDYERTTTSFDSYTTGSGKEALTYQRYPVRRRTTETTTDINTGVPDGTSGNTQISMSDLRGSESP